ncbi:unnamed protein product [Clonostachys chloroleuca]|uniref:Bifunctional cytochrome P450/NADPH--P450 reductase n=1 Tax=Clonostachys chloroleuca TaxID=1926264 RepID=A0AA35MI78_9HYPO|nr:unnamed protein product [Clonostachys chloroleuca]
MAATAEIPEPPAYPFIGHVFQISPTFQLGSMRDLADQYGDIYRLRFPGVKIVVLSTQALINETCDEKRFKKCIAASLEHIRLGVHDGLFTARDGEEAWGVAHRVLIPDFGPLKIRGMYDEMYDVAKQLSLKWARGGPREWVKPTEDFTRLTLDTIALCSMGFRFNSFYSQEMHPFVQAMADFLYECGEIDTRIFPSFFYRNRDNTLSKNIDTLRRTAQDVLDTRKSGLDDRDNDLLAAMLKGVDPQTGKKMADGSILDNLITFLIAGHETTSGMLSYAFYQMLHNPETFQKAQQEIDTVCGKGRITIDHISKLPYINAVLRETLRLTSTIPAFSVEPMEDTMIAGKYFVKKGQPIVNLVFKAHLDPAVYGDTVNEFIPERMLDDNFNRLNREFPNCWKPFGNGKRSCIGRAFAWQEALLIMAMLLQNFNFELEPGYELSHKQTLTIKPDRMAMRAILRDGLTPVTLEQRLGGSGPRTSDSKAAKAGLALSEGKGKPLTILYGSNSGTCKSLAQQVATNAPRHGFSAVKLDSLDTGKESLPTDHPTVIVTASFEGEPPDNAGQFVSWIQNLDAEKRPLDNASYAVFGCGHSDWVNTHQRIPKLINSRLADLGAERLVGLGTSDVATGATFGEFEAWEDGMLWPALKARYGDNDQGNSASTFEPQGVIATVSHPRNSTLRQDVRLATVIKTETLTAYEGGELTLKKHVEVELPPELKYETGDYLVVLPVNPEETVRRAMRALGLSSDAHLDITSDVPVALPLEGSVSAKDVLSSYVELSQPATKRNILKLIQITSDEKTIQGLTSLANDHYAEEITAKRVSVLDLLERFPALYIPIGTFLSMLPPIRVRQYSISSSPLLKASHATLTFSTLREPSLSNPSNPHIGVASSYLASLQPSDVIQVIVRPSPPSFSLPSDPETTPLFLVAAGTGIAPFRAFIQERALQISSGKKLAPAYLYFGCRSPETDDLYRAQLDEWERLGAVQVRRAYSRSTTTPESQGCKYVQDRLWKDRKEVWDLWEKGGAKMFVCGSKAVGEGVRDAMIRMKREASQEDERGESELTKWFHAQRNVRYVEDIFD